MAIYIPIVSEFKSAGIDKAKKEFKSLEGAGAKAGFILKKSFLPATAALGAFGGFMVAAAKGAEDARIANEKLGSVLDTMGYGKATDRVSAYAESLEKSVAVDADVIKATQTKLATFSALTKSVNLAGGSFDRATKAALDMAAAGFGTAEGNAVQLGKALQDPIKGLAALAKSGVTFTEQEKEKIKTLVESGKELQAQEMILKAIEGQVGGTAEASASSFDKMKFAVAGVSDTFGDMMLPVIDALAPKLAAFSAWAQENPGLMKIVVGTFVALTAAVVALNIAMSLNPISLIVIGIGLLIAGLAAAYIKFEGFRKLVDVIFDGIKLGFGLVVTYLKTVAGIYKGIFNGIATGWNNTIGKLSFSIPDIKGLPGRGTKFEAPKIPLLADGGLIMNGAQLAIVGEAGPEAVIPLDRMSEFTGAGAGMNITVNAGLVSSPDQVGQQIIEAIQKAQRRSGVVFAPA
jgi:phage-related minor tail protein